MRGLQQFLLTILVLGLSTIKCVDIDQTTLTLNSYTLINNAVADLNTIQLTPDTASTAGRALYDVPFDVASGFTVTIYFDVASSGTELGEGFGFIVGGETNSIINSMQSAGQGLNIATLSNVVTIVVDMVTGSIVFCQADPSTNLPSDPATSPECTNSPYPTPGAGSHTMVVSYSPKGNDTVWTVSVNGAQVLFNPGGTFPLVPTTQNEYYFAWVGANGGTAYANKTLTGWFANITEPCTNNGGCSADASCAYLGNGQVKCTCLSGFEGDGIVCIPIPPVDTPIDPPVAAPVSVPVDTPQGQVTTPPGPKIEVIVPAIVVPVVGAAVAIFLGVYFGKKKQAKKKTKANSDDLEDGDGAMALTSTANATGIAPSNYGTVPSMSGVNGQYNSIPNIETVRSDKSDIAVTVSEINPTGINPSEIDKRMHIPYKSLVFTKEIGAGSYGKVFLGEWRGAEVAIKVNNTVTDMEGFLAEAKLTLGIAPHPNLVQTFGISLDGAYPCIVLEFCGGGSLDKLVTNTESTVTDAKRKEFALKIAYGLIHLHNNNIVHRDLAARNILLSTEGQPKISDFGMSRVIQDEEARGKTKTNVGPVRWMAPESLKDKSYSVKSDVWTYGILIWEIVTGKEPHADEDQLFVGVKIRDEAFHPAIPDNCDPVLREVMEMCWKKDPAERPTMEEIAKHLRKN